MDKIKSTPTSPETNGHKLARAYRTAQTIVKQNKRREEMRRHEEERMKNLGDISRYGVRPKEEIPTAEQLIDRWLERAVWTMNFWNRLEKIKPWPRVKTHDTKKQRRKNRRKKRGRK